jgi:hypothetical protein
MWWVGPSLRHITMDVLEIPHKWLILIIIREITQVSIVTVICAIPACSAKKPYKIGSTLQRVFHLNFDPIRA